MNNLLLFILLSFIQGQTQKIENPNIKRSIPNTTKIENEIIEKKFVQVNSLERSGLYEEALNLLKEINSKSPGRNKYFHALKNHLKRIESLDSLLLYTHEYANARNQDIQSKLEYIDVYIWLNQEDKWQKICLDIVTSNNLNENTMKNLYPQSHVIPRVTTGFTDSHFTRDLGIQSYGFNPIIVPLTDLGRIHGNDERINIKAFKKSVQDHLAIIKAIVYD